MNEEAGAKGNASRAADVIKNWLRNRYTIEFLGVWEIIHNPDFKVVEFDHIGIIVRKGRYGGTYAHRDIAFEFGSAISVSFKLYLIEEFQRLKEAEQKQLGWSVKRELAKINYRIHASAIKQHLIPDELTTEQKPYGGFGEACLIEGGSSNKWLF